MMICLKPTNLKIGRQLLFTLLIAVGVLLSGSAVNAQTDIAFPVEVVKIKTAKGEFYFQTELAVTVKQRQRGLMFRRAMAADRAMMFNWAVSQPVGMWMKNTYVSLDMVFIRKDGQVVNIARATTPYSLTPMLSNGPVAAVLELIAGTADKIGLAPGDRVFHRSFQ